VNVPVTAPAIVLGIVSLGWIALLARIFFLPGEWNLQWWLNTGPFAVGGVAMLAVLGGWLTPFVAPSTPAGGALAVAAVLLIAAGLLLGGYTLGTHRRRLALWHQRDDAPDHLVEQGPYVWIRHPFYTSYLISLIGCVLAAPHATTVVVLGFVAYRLNGTAAREEARFLASSSCGARYAAYMRRTGRFLPRMLARYELRY
jgi:protein-S-isoprenylcysteine O-methyltransferase Ste14